MLSWVFYFKAKTLLFYFLLCAFGELRLLVLCLLVLRLLVLDFFALTRLTAFGELRLTLRPVHTHRQMPFLFGTET